MLDKPAESSPPLRVVVMGTGPFAVPMFEALCASRHVVVGVVTQPQREIRGRALPPGPMRVAATMQGRPIFDPPSINTDEARVQLRAWAPDVLVVADYGQILKPATLAVARLGGVNLHGSVLPKYRGAAPINWAIWNGDPETGVTVIEMSPTVDAGPMLAIARTPIGSDETAPELEARLAAMGAPLVVAVIEQLAAGVVVPLVQDAQAATPARRLRKTDATIDWTRSAVELQRQIRALEPWPRTSTCWLRPEMEPVRIIPGRVRVLPESDAVGEVPAVPGTVVAADRAGIVVATGAGRLVLESLQPAGKRMMSAAEFLNGHGACVGHRFGPELQR